MVSPGIAIAIDKPRLELHHALIAVLTKIQNPQTLPVKGPCRQQLGGQSTGGDRVPGLQQIVSMITQGKGTVTGAHQLFYGFGRAAAIEKWAATGVVEFAGAAGAVDRGHSESGVRCWGEFVELSLLNWVC